jgi:hypothetical protein
LDVAGQDVAGQTLRARAHVVPLGLIARAGWRRRVVGDVWD